MQTGSRKVRLFRNGRNRAVRIPVEFELPGDEAILRREGEAMLIEPLPKRRFLDLLTTWEPLALAGADGRRTAGCPGMLPFRSGSSSGSDR
jgi:antitoxin VapB